MSALAATGVFDWRACAAFLQGEVRARVAELERGDCYAAYVGARPYVDLDHAMPRRRQPTTHDELRDRAVTLSCALAQIAACAERGNVENALVFARAGLRETA